MAAGIVLHFHPGWAHGDCTVLDAMVAAGSYRSQWLTGTSNGGLTAHPGGERWRWESRLFDGRYDDGDPVARPVYGAWNCRDDHYGAAPRFGSAYLWLRPEMVERATFCWPDSVYDPQAVGGADRLAELCELADAGLLARRCYPRPRPTCPSTTRSTTRWKPTSTGVSTSLGTWRRSSSTPATSRRPAPPYTDWGCWSRSTPATGPRPTTSSRPTAGAVPIALARELGCEVTPARLAAAQRSGRHDPQAV